MLPARSRQRSERQAESRPSAGAARAQPSRVGRAALLLALAALAIPTAEPLQAARPNILLIVSEDNGPELGAYGDRYAKTPHLDALAASGVLFENAYVPQAGCSQSRAALLTGFYPHQNGQIGLATWRFRLYRDETPNIVRSLKRAGYRTGIIGKLHVNPEAAFPFDFAQIPNSNFRRENLGAYATEAEAFFRASDQPFFLSVNYPDAHRPFLKQAAGRPQRPVGSADVASLGYMGLDSPTLRQDTANYYNSLSRLDSLVGDLLTALQNSGKAGRTLVVYLGDHGADLLRGKRTCYEGGVRIPLIVRWSGRQQEGQTRPELVSTLDLMPTFLKAAGAEPIPGLPGRSLTPLLAGKSVPWRDFLFTEYHLHSNHNYYPQRAVRSERYKLIWNLRPGSVNPGYAFTVAKFYSQEEMAAALARAPQAVRQAYELMRQPPEFELYDLRLDPFEFRNLAAKPGHRKVLAELKTTLLAWRRQTADPFLEPENVERLRAEIEATRQNGEYRKPSGWAYSEYLAPDAPPWAVAARSNGGREP